MAEGSGRAVGAFLSSVLNRPCSDRTGATGEFDLTGFPDIMKARATCRKKRLLERHLYCDSGKLGLKLETHQRVLLIR